MNNEQEIKRAQINAAEQVVINNLMAKGLIINEPQVPSMEQTLNEKIVAIIEDKSHWNGDDHAAANAIERLFYEEQIKLLNGWIDDLEDDSNYSFIVANIRAQRNGLTNKLNQ